MRTGMLGDSGALRRLWGGLLLDLVVKLNGEDGPKWEKELGKFLRKEAAWQEQLGIFRKMTVVRVSGSKRFVAQEHIGAANVGWVGENFKRAFAAKVEENVGDVDIAAYRLEKVSLDSPILSQLGERAEISLTHLFELLKKQSKGEQGFLLINGYANIAYVRDAEGILWAVSAHWNSYDGYWNVGARSVETPAGWCEGRRILSRDS